MEERSLTDTDLITERSVVRSITGNDEPEAYVNREEMAS